ncbi:FAD-binding oxidoreductase [Micrococcus sp.]|uniref:FAD-binding oxidoreductase n=1 Tax=Micrococcus sp. TaxID=1271 RepID=UPI002A90DB7D|nr:FAD-linked oxidase C-terminal domain-containing protein [Micrococcus sp.]MDY6054853.1 FAD-linked oxidase C-terminal domain-containing protein [Micrococcus sp.]
MSQDTPDTPLVPTSTPTAPSGDAPADAPAAVVAPEEVLARLQEALPGRVDTSPEALALAGADRSGYKAATDALCLVRAESVEDVQAVCRIASETRTPVVPRGAASGISGGSVAGDGAISLDLNSMNRILEISVADRVAVVEPGILNGDLNRALAEHGLWWAPDPASKDISTVGGNIALNAGGLLCAKYGVTREAVLGLSVVLADGTLLELGHRSVKGVTGYDLTALMIGSEGTLGVIVGATLALRPVVTSGQVTVGGFFPDVVAAASASAAITAAGLVPAIMELLDEANVDAIRRYTLARGEDASALPEHGAYLLVQTDGPGAEAEGARVAELMEANRGQVRLTSDPEVADELTGLRRLVFPSLEALGTVLVEDVAVPRSKMPEMFARIREIEAATGVQIPTAAHAGDGNLHPIAIYEPVEDASATGVAAGIPADVWDAVGQVFRAALDLGGTLTGEHGVGVLKREFLRDELGDAQYALQERVKAAFDPLGILNPGKVFDL